MPAEDDSQVVTAGRPVGSGGSLRRRVTWGFAMTSVLLVIGAALAALGLATAAQDRTRLLSRVDPAIEHLSEYETALVNQSSGARLYAELGTPSALSTYRQGLATATTAGSLLDGNLRALPPLSSRLAQVKLLIQKWQVAYLAPMVARRGPNPAATTVTLTTGSSLAFLQIRQRFAGVASVLGHVRTGAVRDFNDALNLLVGLVIAVLTGVAVLLVAVWTGLRQSVLVPLLAVGADSRLVTAGAFDHAVATTGPVEIAGLALDIDAMRSRVVDDLHALEAAHREVAAQRLELEERAIELSRSNRDLEQFAYVASHDLQEPLRKVAAFCQLLSERYHDQLDDKGQQYIEFAVDGAKRMQSLVNDLLAFSRVGRTDEKWSEVPLGDAVRTAISYLETRIERSRATVTFPAALPTVRGDASLLTALFQNLIGNAIKFRSDDAPTVDVTCSRAGRMCEVRVTDNGIGIEPQYAARVFVIFQRLHSRDRYEGTGIGLALCRKIVEFHGGTIEVDQHPGPGTTMIFTLPASVHDPEVPDA